MPALEKESFGRRAQRALTRLLVFCLVVSLLGAVTFLLSQLNARRFSVATLNGNLVVMKGRPLPIGTLAFHPVDPRQREAYAPLPLHGTDPGPLLIEAVAMAQTDIISAILYRTYDAVESAARRRRDVVRSCDNGRANRHAGGDRCSRFPRT